MQGCAGGRLKLTSAHSLRKRAISQMKRKARARVPMQIPNRMAKLTPADSPLLTCGAGQWHHALSTGGTHLCSVRGHWAQLSSHQATAGGNSSARHRMLTARNEWHSFSCSSSNEQHPPRLGAIPPQIASRGAG